MNDIIFEFLYGTKDYILHKKKFQSVLDNIIFCAFRFDNVIVNHVYISDSSSNLIKKCKITDDEFLYFYTFEILHFKPNFCNTIYIKPVIFHWNDYVEYIIIC